MSLLERRLRAEWELLLELQARNPTHLFDLHALDTTFTVELRGPACPAAADPGKILEVHDIRIVYPVHFPAVPMELYLAQPVQHPNVHPETGFVCVWESHRVSHTVEVALHKTAAMLSGTLFNAAPLHLMQPDAVAAMKPHGVPFLLAGVAYPTSCLVENTPFLQTPHRKPRLS